MKIKKLSETPVMDNSHTLDARNLYDAPEAVITVLTLKEGERLRRHITPVDVCFYVLSGSGTVEIGEEKEVVERDTLIESPKGIVHCWYNTGNESLRILVVKTPKPVEKTVFLEDE